MKFPDDFIASIPVYLQLTERVTFEVLPFSSYALSPMMLPLLETFLELLLWNSFQMPSSHIFGCLQYPEIFVPLRQTLFL
jgi:hypothetical protein